MSQRTFFFLVGVSLCLFLSNTVFSADPVGRNFSGSALICEAKSAFCEPPLTVQVRFRINDRDQYNIIIANERKDSPCHWEIYSDKKTGNLCAYAPNFFGGLLNSGICVADDKWHEAALVLGKEKAVLYLDGKAVAQKPVKAVSRKSAGQALHLGELVGGGMGMKGLIDEVRISGTEGEPPAAPWPTEGALAHWVFDGQKGALTDKSPAKRVLRPAKTYVEMGSPALVPYEKEALAAYAEPSELENRVRTLGQSLGLSSLSLDNLYPGVWNLWTFDYDNYGKVDYADLRGGEKLNRSDEWKQRSAAQAFDKNAVIWKEDKGPAGTVLRRALALAQHLKNTQADPQKLAALTADLEKLKSGWDKLQSPSEAQTLDYYYTACALRRQVAFLNPLLDFDPVLAVARGTFEKSVRTLPRTSDNVGGHMSTQYFGFNALPAGGLYVFSGWKQGKPLVRDLLKDAVVQNGRYRGRTLAGGAVATPDLSYDGKKIAFAWSANDAHAVNRFSRDRVFHIFTINADGTDLRQLTDGPYDDFDPYFMPNGRLAFVSERRGGHIRCFNYYLKVPNYTLFSMNQDGGDIKPLSYFETSEWNPSVNNDGMLVYTRWDYVDRENCIGGRFWIAGPDGTNPRAPHGNYPHPYNSTPAAVEAFCKAYPQVGYKQGDWGSWGSRWGTPLVQMGIRAIPGSHRYVFTASPHHGQVYGSIGILDLRKKDDGYMSQVLRLTPDEPFPETEIRARSHHKYGTPWPLSEDFYLANSWEDVILLDRFGNREFLCGVRELPCFPDEKLRLVDPIPLRARPMPPIVPDKTNHGEGADPEGAKATISVANVYDTDLPLPEGVKIKWLRVVQNILKTNHTMGLPMVGHERENCPRIPLGIVPVEDDGSVYFKAPVAKELIFQLLDEDFRAVHSMRSVAFVFPGEQLSCLGCHEPDDRAPATATVPKAFRRAPSELMPELGPIEPISYYRQIKPIVENFCLPCHRKAGKGPTDLSYNSFKDDNLWFSGGMAKTMIGKYPGIHGGSRTIPGTFGARSSKVGQALMKEPHLSQVSEKDRHTFITWLDCNNLRLGAFEREQDQLRGELVWPALDVDPDNPQGIDGTLPGLKRNFWHENHYGPYAFVAGSHKLGKVFIMNKDGECVWEFPAQAPQDVWMLPNSNILFASLHAVREVTPDKQVVWEFKVDAPNEIPTCQPLPNGNVLIGIVGECRLIEVNRKGEIVHEIKLKTPVARPHAQFRMCRKTPEGTYLVPFSDEGQVREYNAKGEVIRHFPPMKFPVCAVRLPNGNTLISGDGGVTEYDPADNIVWQLDPKLNTPDIAMAIPAGVQRLPNGNTIVCNWGSTDKDGRDGAHIFEITPDKRVVWQVGGDTLGKVAQCQLLTDELKPREDFKNR